jgi:putative SOS response-associated peptidase YedK
MCGKFTQMATWKEVVAFSQPLVAARQGDPVTVSTPMRLAQIMRLDEGGRREMVAMRWGFSRHGAAVFKPDHMHARGETIDSRPRFCDAFVERRGIVMVETFNEGEKLENGKTKQWVIRPRDRLPIAMAVIWEDWQGESASELTFVMITTPPNAVISKVTDRMPAILRQEDWPVWLGECNAPLRDIKALLQTFDDEGNWEMSEQSEAKQTKPPPPKPQMDLF